MLYLRDEHAAFNVPLAAESQLIINVMLSRHTL